MCNPALHPLWSVIGKPAGFKKPGPVWMIVSFLMQDDPILQLLDDKGKVAVLAEWSGLKTIQVALVLAGLQHYGLMVEGRVVLAQDDENVLIASERLNKTGKTPDNDRARLLRQARNRRYYCKRNGLPPDQPAANPIDSKTVERLNQTPPSLEEKEQESLFPSGAREVKPAVGWGVQAEADKQAKRQKWLSNVTEYAKPHLAASDWARLCEAAVQDEVPRWAQAELDEWSRRMKADKERPPPRRPDPQQPEMLMPIASKPARLTGMREDWNERMVNYQRLVRG